MHFCRAQVAIGGDNNNIAYLNEFDPVSWPEILVLQEVHGPEAVTDVEAVAQIDVPSRTERERLAQKYGDGLVSHVFGGKQGPSEMDMPRTKVKAGVSWMNPYTHKVEVSGEDSAFKPLERRPDELEDPTESEIAVEGSKPNPRSARRR